ncbi:amidohydrolase [Aureisphaera sp. CAU 1614]|uniref:Omega-amidase YafV n=1 Tax=Halomarinibacterium sedimenti TaxID=2857106 RepID=A0A9X1FM93_9FLAO|nr:amidohydrolase [Halomarinibacterium sedimenti]MBW2937071.1 amidohydrolase [Halomarinibacterium sedimenti]
MNDLKVTLIQSYLHWENPEANRAMFSEKIDTISEQTDLIVLPEMFTTGFTMNASTLAEAMQGPTLQWMIKQSIKVDAAIAGSVIIKEDNQFFNRLLFVYKNEILQYYDKRHTFTLAGENEVFTAGNTKLIIDYKNWRICPLVCYDLRFPVWARNTEDYDVLLYVANWPKKRIAAWDALLKARAIENMAYCVGVNRTGLDGNGHEYIGHSAVYDILGEQVSIPAFEKEFMETIVLSKEHIQQNREHLQFLRDRDSFTLQ